MDEQQLNILLERAAERGARRALESVGLHDEEAGKDVRDLRTLIDGWRTAKKTALTTITRYITLAFLGLLMLGAWSQLTGKK
jgi:hypothetical protein